MTDNIPEIECPPAVPAGSPLPGEIELVSAYAWQHNASETILFQGQARLTTAAGPLALEKGTWLLVRWPDQPLPDTPDGELICILPESL